MGQTDDVLLQVLGRVGQSLLFMYALVLNVHHHCRVFVLIVVQSSDQRLKGFDERTDFFGIDGNNRGLGVGDSTTTQCHGSAEAEQGDEQ